MSRPDEEGRSELCFSDHNQAHSECDSVTVHDSHLLLQHIVELAAVEASCHLTVHCFEGSVQFVELVLDQGVNNLREL